MRRSAGDTLDGADLALEAEEIELFDDAPDLAGRMIVIDQLVDVERFEAELLAVDGEVAGGGRKG